jgi:hypothetical protein
VILQLACGSARNIQEPLKLAVSRFPQPSEVLAAIDAAQRRIWIVNPYVSAFGTCPSPGKKPESMNEASPTPANPESLSYLHNSFCVAGMLSAECQLLRLEMLSDGYQITRKFMTHKNLTLLVP